MEAKSCYLTKSKEINSIGAGFYSSNQESALSKAAARLVVSGTTAIVTAGTAVVSANRKVLLHLINRQDVEDFNVRKLPIGKDGILERINYRLDDRTILSPRNIQDRRAWKFGSLRRTLA